MEIVVLCERVEELGGEVEKYEGKGLKGWIKKVVLDLRSGL